MKVAFVCSGKSGNLKYLKNNRTLVENTLRSLNWEVVSTPLSDISDLNKQLNEYTKNTIDEFIFFFTGHGDVSNQQQILKLQLDNSKVGINEILDSISEYINPKKQAMIFDACYSATLKGLNLNKNIEFLFSSQAKEQSYESDDLKHSIFTYYFCEAVENTQSNLALNHIEQYIRLKSKKQDPLSINISTNAIIFSKSNLKEKKVHTKTLPPQNNIPRVHPIYYFALFLAIIFFVKEHYFSLPIIHIQEKDTTLTKILLEDRVQDKIDLEKTKTALMLSEKARAILEKKYQQLLEKMIREATLKKLSKKDISEIIKEADKLCAIKGIKYGINFLTIRIKLIQKLEISTKNKPIDDAIKKVETQNKNTNNSKEDIIYQVELYENSQNNIETCEIEYNSYQSMLVINCNNTINYLDITHTPKNEILNLISNHSTSFNSVKENFYLYKKIDRSIIKIYNQNKLFAYVYFNKPSFFSNIYNEGIYEEVKSTFTKSQYSKFIFQEIYNELIKEKINTMDTCQSTGLKLLSIGKSIIENDYNKTNIELSFNNLTEENYLCPKYIQKDLSTSQDFIQNLLNNKSAKDIQLFNIFRTKYTNYMKTIYYRGYIHSRSIRTYGINNYILYIDNNEGYKLFILDNLLIKYYSHFNLSETP